MVGRRKAHDSIDGMEYTSYTFSCDNKEDPPYPDEYFQYVQDESVAHRLRFGE